MKTLSMVLLIILAFAAQAESKRVNVFENSQQYWDVVAGQSLSGICNQLKSNGSNSQLSCQAQVLKKNPSAFINKDINRLIAGKRLWLPGSYQSVSRLDDKKYDVKRFSWGVIKTAK